MIQSPKWLSTLLILLGVGCVSTPEGIKPVKNFQLDRYLGKWYEIARLDHSFERGLSNITAEYSLGEDGRVIVLNRGYSEKKKIWKQAKGKAYFVENNNTGFLKVSFFGPFYGSYIVTELDFENYQYALVCGPSREYLWILSRSPDLPKNTVNYLKEKAVSLGYNTQNLIFVNHNLNEDQK